MELFLADLIIYLVQPYDLPALIYSYCLSCPLFCCFSSSFFFPLLVSVHVAVFFLFRWLCRLNITTWLYDTEHREKEKKTKRREAEKREKKWQIEGGKLRRIIGRSFLTNFLFLILLCPPFAKPPPHPPLPKVVKTKKQRAKTRVSSTTTITTMTMTMTTTTTMTMATAPTASTARLRLSLSSEILRVWVQIYHFEFMIYHVYFQPTAFEFMIYLYSLNSAEASVFQDLR